MEKVSFIKDPQNYNQNDCLVVHLSNIESKEQLLSDLNTVLKFPYFGFNWDALNDLLRDFHWIKEKGIVIVHDNLPKLDQKSFSTYIKVLIDSAIDWSNSDEHYLKLVFPSQDEKLIQEYFDKKD